MVKSSKKKNTFLMTTVLIIVISILSFVLINNDSHYIPTAYEKELIDYFKEIALQSEYDDNPQKVIKWKEPMLLHVIKEKEYIF